MPSPYDLYTEFFIDGAWTSAYSARVRYENGILITRGLDDQQSSMSAQTSAFTLNNRDGLFSNRNPNSPLYRKIPQNTPVRHRIGALDSHVKIRNPANTALVETADKAQLDITGDIDIRIELTPDTWRPDLEQYFCGKWTNTQRSWHIRLKTNGALGFSWSSDGTTSSTGTTTNTIPATSARLAIRLTFDVVDGANKTRTWYTGPSINGPWTLFETSTTAGNTSLFNSSATLQVGAANNGSAFVNGSNGFGKYHAFELRNGIDGTLVASLAVQSVTPGTASWSDGLGNTWNLVGANARVGSDVHRFTGEMTAFPSKWDVTGKDVYVPATAAGVLRRLSQRSSALNSAIYRNFVQFAAYNTLHAPMEEGSGSKTLANVSTLPNKAVNRITNVSFTGTAPPGLPGSSGSLVFNAAPNSSQVVMRASSLANTGNATFILYFKLLALPAADSKLISITTSGTGVTWTVSIGAAGFAFNILDRDGATLSSATVLYGTGASPLNQWLGISLRGTQEGANVRWRNVWHVVGTDGFFTSTTLGITYAGTLGRFTAMTLLSTDATFQGAEFAHALISQLDLDIASTFFQQSSNAFIGEAAGTRAARLADEENLRLDMYGDPSQSELMGPQNADTLSNLLEECRIADLGMISELRDDMGFAFYTRRFMENKQPTVITYTDNTLAATPEPVEDDRYIQNDVTAVRPTGGYERFEVSSGALSVQQPPNGVGRYETTIPVNVAVDSQLLDQASYRAFRGTWDEARIPALRFGLHRRQVYSNTTLLERLYAADVASWFRLKSMPSFMPPDDLDLVVAGMSEEIYRHTIDFTYTLVPGGPYRVPIIDDADNPVRFDADNSTLDTAITTTTATSIQVTNGGVVADTWVPTSLYPSEVPFGIVINGETMTVTNVGDIFSTTKQTLTVTRSVNGIAKTHAVGSQVRLSRPYYITL